MKLLKLVSLASATILSSYASANLTASETPNAHALIGERVIVEVLPDDTQFTEKQIERLQTAGFFRARPAQYAANGLVDWFKAGPAKLAKVISIGNEATKSSNHFQGKASYYGGRHSSKYQGEYTAAHRSLPFGTKVRVTYGGRSVIVVINDRGPFIRGRVIDLDTGAARAIGLTGVGVGEVTCEVL